MKAKKELRSAKEPRKNVMILENASGSPRHHDRLLVVLGQSSQRSAIDDVINRSGEKAAQP